MKRFVRGKRGAGGSDKTDDGAQERPSVEDQRRETALLLAGLRQAAAEMAHAFGRSVETSPADSGEADSEVALAARELVECSVRLTEAVQDGMFRLLPKLPADLGSPHLSQLVHSATVDALAQLVEEHKGEALKELREVAGGAVDSIESLVGEIDEEALSITSAALSHPICGLAQDIAKEHTAKSKQQLWHVREVAAFSAMRVIDVLDRAMRDMDNTNDD
eukprot:964446-Prymnesium_polylepis.1